jgi:hypothetical protein
MVYPYMKDDFIKAIESQTDEQLRANVAAGDWRARFAVAAVADNSFLRFLPMVPITVSDINGNAAKAALSEVLLTHRNSAARPSQS